MNLKRTGTLLKTLLALMQDHNVKKTTGENVF
jgi:hypothetical protein